MTLELFRNNSYLKEHNATISDVIPEGLIFKETIFYPEGGGQPGDVGSIKLKNKTINIVGTKYINNKLVHLTETIDDIKKMRKVA